MFSDWLVWKDVIVQEIKQEVTKSVSVRKMKKAEKQGCALT